MEPSEAIADTYALTQAWLFKSAVTEASIFLRRAPRVASMSDARSCGALLSFAEEQLSRVPSHSTVNLSHIVSHAHLQNAGLIICLHDEEELGDAEFRRVV